MKTTELAGAIDVARWRQEFPIVETCTYLVSHSLGAMPRKTADYLQEFADTWSSRGVRAWHEGWWEIGRETGNLLAPILGVEKNTISMHQNVTVAQGVIASCFSYGHPRHKIVMTDLEFPSNHYLFEGFRRYGAEIVYVPSSDPIRIDLQRLLDAIDEQTVLVPLSLVLFKSAAITDARAVIDKAHHVGAHVILDVYQGAGAVPMDLNGWDADFAVGGSVKWLCGGPGAGYLYVRPDLARDAQASLRRLGGARNAVRVRDRRHPLRRQSRALPERHAERAVAVFGARRLRDRRRDRRARDPRTLAGADPAHHRRRAGCRLSAEHAARRSRARRVGDRRRAERRCRRRRTDPARRDRRSSSRRRHPHGAALLQHGSRKSITRWRR